MMYFYTKNKRSIWLFIATFIFLFFYDTCLIATIRDLGNVKEALDIGLLYTAHPLLPLPRAIKELMQIQYFDKVGFIEVIKTITYVIASLSIFEILFLILVVYLSYQYLFKKDRVNSLTFHLLLAHFILFIIHISVSSFRLYDSFVGVNESVVNTMRFLQIFSIVCVVIYYIMLAISILCMYIFSQNKVNN